MNVELLAPAGSFKKMQYAFKYGADACYLGLPNFSLRARLNDFDIDEVKRAIRYAHSIGKKIYLTFNIFAHNFHIDRLDTFRFKSNIDGVEKDESITEYFNSEDRPDAVIISDPGILYWFNQNIKNVPIHLSTQANTLNYMAVKFWKEQAGVSRVILGREASVDDIKNINENIKDFEIETFVHGAMCMAYSGRCFLSKHFTGASANLGACAQPCRWQYTPVEEIVNEDKEREVILMEDENGSYFFNSHDMCLLPHLKELMDIGVCSFKIEGRTKSIFYVSMVVKAYRDVIDKIKNNSLTDDDLKYWRGELNKLVNRGYSTGFLFNEIQDDLSLVDESHLKNDYRFVGEVVNFSNEFVTPTTCGVYVLAHNKMIVGDLVDIIPSRDKNFSLKIEKIIDPENNEELSEMSGGYEKIVFMKFDKDIVLEEGTLIMKNFIL